MPPYRARLYGYAHLDAHVLPIRRARLRDGEALPKRRFFPRTYPYNHNFVLICICFLEETLPKRRFCPKTYSYVHNSVLICIYFLRETLPKR
ncbi:hypothetical protein Taro_056263, partial [Colocasia esculenta]|nr:hypothetical protein [Colocasia esculenta]